MTSIPTSVPQISHLTLPPIAVSIDDESIDRVEKLMATGGDLPDELLLAACAYANDHHDESLFNSCSMRLHRNLSQRILERDEMIAVLLEAHLRDWKMLRLSALKTLWETGVLPEELPHELLELYESFHQRPTYVNFEISSEGHVTLHALSYDNTLPAPSVSEFLQWIELFGVKNLLTGVKQTHLATAALEQCSQVTNLYARLPYRTPEADKFARALHANQTLRRFDCWVEHEDYEAMGDLAYDRTNVYQALMGHPSLEDMEFHLHDVSSIEAAAQLVKSTPNLRRVCAKRSNWSEDDFAIIWNALKQNSSVSDLELEGDDALETAAHFVRQGQLTALKLWCCPSLNIDSLCEAIREDTALKSLALSQPVREPLRSALAEHPPLDSLSIPLFRPGDLGAALDLLEQNGPVRSLRLVPTGCSFTLSEQEGRRLNAYLQTCTELESLHCRYVPGLERALEGLPLKNLTMDMGCRAEGVNPFAKLVAKSESLVTVEFRGSKVDHTSVLAALGSNSSVESFRLDRGRLCSDYTTAVHKILNSNTQLKNLFIDNCTVDLPAQGDPVAESMLKEAIEQNSTLVRLYLPDHSPEQNPWDLFAMLDGLRSNRALQSFRWVLTQTLEDEDQKFIEQVKRSNPRCSIKVT